MTHYEHDGRQRQDHTTGYGSGSSGGSPGKRTLTQSLPPRPVIYRVASDPRDGNNVAVGADAAVDRASGSAGAALRSDVRERFESSLGADLSGVRVHTGDASAEAASSVGARAYTVGNDIHFGAGQYQPDDPFGLHLLAHEVAHTQQQAGGTPHRQNKLEVSTPGDAAEHEADRAADAMVAGQAAAVGSARGGIARAEANAAPKGAILLPFEKVDEVWKGYVRQFMKAHPPEPGENPEKAMSLARQATKKQVGDLNYKRWVDEGGGCVWTDAVQYRTWTAEEHAEYDAAHQPKEKFPLPWEGLQGRVKGLSSKASAIHKAINAVERQCQQLASPEGAAGIAYQITVGTYGLAYGVAANGVNAAKDQIDPTVQAVKLGKKREFEPDVDGAKTVADSAQTSVEVMSGRLNDLYKKTRGAYGTYDAAYKDFCEARTAFNRAQGGPEQSEAFGNMSSALDRMVAESEIYVGTCNALGIPQKAVAVDKLAAAIVTGAGSAIELGVGMLAGGLGVEIPKAVEAGHEVVKQVASDAGK